MSSLSVCYNERMEPHKVVQKPLEEIEFPEFPLVLMDKYDSSTRAAAAWLFRDRRMKARNALDKILEEPLRNSG